MGPTYWKRQRMWLKCPECVLEVADGLIIIYRQIKGGMGWGNQRGLPPPLPRGGEARAYWVYFPKTLSRLRCPADRYLGGEQNRTNLQVQFVHCHIQDTIAILEEGNKSYPRCTKCDMFVS